METKYDYNLIFLKFLNIKKQLKKIKQIGELNVQLQTSFGLTGKPIWRRDQQHGNVWLRAHVKLSPANITNIANYRIAIEGIVGKGFKGDVAVDELVFTPNKPCSPVSEFGDLVVHYCDFETNDCNYKNELSGRFLRAKPLSINDDPNKDNTYQTKDGIYMQYKVFLLNIYFYLYKMKQS